jgi:hypothetical protein
LGLLATGYISQMGTVGATGWVFGVLILPMQNDLGWSRSVLVGEYVSLTNPSDAIVD